MTYNSSTGAIGAVTGCSVGNGLFIDAVDEGTRLVLVAKDGSPHLDSTKRAGPTVSSCSGSPLGQTGKPTALKLRQLLTTGFRSAPTPWQIAFCNSGIPTPCLSASTAQGSCLNCGARFRGRRHETA